MAVIKKPRTIQERVIDLVPNMSLVAILIPLLLLSVQFIHLAVIDSSLPAIGAPTTPKPQDPDKPPLTLTVAITDKGFIIGGHGGVLGEETPPAEGEEVKPTVPLDSQGNYNYTELTNLMLKIKDEYPDEQNIILVPESDIKYEVLVATMDATRETKIKREDEKEEVKELFPYVVIAGGLK